MIGISKIVILLGSSVSALKILAPWASSKPRVNAPALNTAPAYSTSTSSMGNFMVQFNETTPNAGGKNKRNFRFLNSNLNQHNNTLRAYSPSASPMNNFITMAQFSSERGGLIGQDTKGSVGVQFNETTPNAGGKNKRNFRFLNSILNQDNNTLRAFDMFNDQNN